MNIEFYKTDLDFPLSGGDYFSSDNRKTIKRILNCLKPFIGKKTNIIIELQDKNKILISNFIYFCKLEGLDYKNVLEIEILQEKETFKIVVNEGKHEDIQILKID